MRAALSTAAHDVRVPAAALAVDIVRHVLPLVPLYVYNGDFASDALMTAFDLSLGLMLIVGTTRDRGDVTSLDPRSRWLGTFAALSFALIAFGWTGLRALPIAYATLLVFYDARPDIAQRIFPKLSRERSGLTR